MEASSFNPATSANHFLLHDSEPDGPVIVSSDRTVTANGNGNGITRQTPAPIGSNGISPTRAKVVYTTDVSPGTFVGGHYMKLEVNSANYHWLFSQLDSKVCLRLTHVTWILSY